MNKGLIALALVLVTTASTMAVQRWYQDRQRMQVKAQPCLRSVAKGLLLYQNANPTPPNTRNSRGHEPEGPAVLYADAGAAFQAFGPTQNDAIYSAAPAAKPSTDEVFVLAIDVVNTPDPVATQPATQPVVGSARSAMIRGCSKNHDQDGQNVLYADGHAEFICAPLAGLQNLYVFATGQPVPSPTTKPAVDLWADLRAGGCVILLRHAKTVGSGSDPANFKIDDRSTQRNLSDEGVVQSKAIGASFRRHGVQVGQVFSSQYYRCRETAEHAFGQATAEASLNSIDDEEQLKQMQKLLESKPANGNTVMVTHQGNLKALTNVIPPMGDAIVIRPNGDGSFRVLGELKTLD